MGPQAPKWSAKTVTPAELVVDASVLAAALFREARAAEADSQISDARRLVAPDLLIPEMVSIGAKKVWLGLITADHAATALNDVPRLVARFMASGPLSDRALSLAVAHRLSGYDALYVALAQARSARLLTFDDKLRRRLTEVGLSNVLHPL